MNHQDSLKNDIMELCKLIDKYKHVDNYLILSQFSESNIFLRAGTDDWLAMIGLLTLLNNYLQNKITIFESNSKSEFNNKNSKLQ